MLRRCLSLVTLLVMVAGLAWNQGINTQANKNDWEEINFDFDSAVLVDGFPSLLRLAELLQANPGSRVRVEGYTDILGGEAYNVKLGQSRANAVRDFLVKYGASASQINTSSQGEANPKVANQGDSYKRTDEGRYMNRRVVLTVTDAQGKAIGAAGGAGDAIRAINQQAASAEQVQKLQDCCDQVLKRLDKLDDIAKMLKDLADQNAGLKRDLDQLKAEHAAMQRALDGQGRGGAAGQPGTAGPAGAQGPAGVGGGQFANGGTNTAAAQPASASDIAKAVRDELNKQGGAGGGAGQGGGSGFGGTKQAFQLLGLNVGSDDRKRISANGRGRFFLPFGNNYGFQAQGEYYYIRGQREAQIDFGLVDRFSKRVQAGLFASFKGVSLAGNQTSGTLGQASFVMDYFFGRGKVGLFGTKAFKDYALVNRANGVGLNGELQRNVILERYLKVVDQVGISGAISLKGNTYAEGNIGYLRSAASSNRAGGSVRFVMPVNNKVAFTIEGGVNETLLPVQGTQQGRAAVGVQLGNFLRPKEYLGADHAVAMEIPRVRYETLTKRVRIGNDPPVADAGPDLLNAAPGTIVLDGSGSYDPDGDPMTYQWVLESGPAVGITNPTSARASFTAAAGQSYSFRLTVKDNQGGQSSARVRVSTALADRVQILFFTTDKNQISGGQTTTLSWRVLNADTVTITGLGTVEATGSRPVNPAATTTYVLTAKNKVNEDSASATVVVLGAKFQYCFASPQTVRAGESATLNWGTNGATNVSITGFGAVAPNGSMVVTPSSDITYTLTASGGSQTDTCSIAVKVGTGGGVSGAPVIGRFSADPFNIEAGQSSTLTWNVSGADSVTISTLGTVQGNGSRSVSPTATTTYILTATNGQGTSTAQATVTVATIALPKVLSFTASPATFTNPGDRIALTCRGENAALIQIAHAGFAGPEATLAVFPTVETTYTCIAKNGRGDTATQTLTVKPVTPPVVDPGPSGPPPTINVVGGDFLQSNNRLIRVDVSGSTSATGGPLTYRWSSDDAISFSDSTSSTPTITLSITLQTYKARLTVTDSKGNSTTKIISIQYVGPRIG